MLQESVRNYVDLSLLLRGLLKNAGIVRSHCQDTFAAPDRALLLHPLQKAAEVFRPHPDDPGDFMVFERHLMRCYLPSHRIRSYRYLFIALKAIHKILSMFIEFSSHVSPIQTPSLSQHAKPPLPESAA